MAIEKFWDDATPQAIKTALESIDVALEALDLTDAQTDVTTIVSQLTTIATNLGTLNTTLGALDFTEAQTDVTSIVTQLTTVATNLGTIATAVAALDLTAAQTDVSTIETRLSTIATALTDLSTTLAALDLTQAQTDLTALIAEIDETGKLLFGTTSAGIEGIRTLIENALTKSDDAENTIFEGIEGVYGVIGTFFTWLNELVGAGAGETFTKWLDEFDEDMKSIGLDFMRATLKRIGLPGDQIGAIISGLSGSVKGAKIAGIGLTLSNLWHGVQAWVPGHAKMAEKADQDFNRFALLELPQIEDIIRYFWKFGDRPELKDMIARLGYPQEPVDIIRGGMEPLFSHGDLQRLRTIYELTDPQALEYLQRMGFSTTPLAGIGKTPVELMMKLLRVVPDTGDLMELFRRGDMPEADYRENLKFLGFDAPARSIFTSLAKRLPTTVEIFELIRRGKLTRAQGKAYLKKYGYIDALEEKVIDLTDLKLDLLSLRTAYFRGLIGKAGYKAGLQKLGYTEKDSGTLETISWILPTPQDIVRFGVREVYTPAIRKRFRQDEDYPPDMTREGKKIGFSDKTMKEYWAAHWDLPAVGQAFEMFHRGIISLGDLGTLLRAKDVMPFWRDKLIGISYRQIPRRSLPRMVKQGLITNIPGPEMTDPTPGPEGSIKLFSQVHLSARFQKLGYSPYDAELMAESAIKAAEEDDKDLTRSELIDAYANEMITDAELRKGLKDMGYSVGESAYFIDKAVKRKEFLELKVGAAEAGAAARTAREITKNEILRSYRVGMITEVQARELFEEAKYDEESVDFFIQYQDMLEAREWSERRAKGYLRRFTEVGGSKADLVRNLVAAGLQPTEAVRIADIAEYERQLDEEIELSKPRQPTKRDINEWLLTGLISPGEWVQYMTAMRYDEKTTRLYLEALMIKQQEIASAR